MRLCTILAVLLVGLMPAGAVPRVVEYGGSVMVDDMPYEGSGHFKFALIEGSTGATLWSHDGTSVEGAEPASSVELAVHGGRYRVRLGDPALPRMSALPPAVFEHADVWLRVWFAAGTDASQLLEPDEQIAAVAYAVVAGSVPDGAITTEKLADGAVRGAKLGPIDASAITTGTIPSARLPNVALANNNLADLTSALEARGNLQLAEPRRGLAQTTRKLLSREWPLTVVLAGDSMIETKRYAIESALSSTYGLAGFGLGRLVAQVESPATLARNAFETWPSGYCYRLEPGGAVTFAHNVVSPVLGDTIKVYYVREPGGGEFKLQTSTGAAPFIDEPGFQQVNAAGELQGTVLKVTHPVTAPLRVRVTGVAGVVRIIGAAIYREHFEGALYCDLSQGGLNLDSTVLASPAIVRPIMQDVAPDLFLFEMKDEAPLLAKHLEPFRQLIDPVGADWILIGSSPYGGDEPDRRQREANRWLRSYASERGFTFWDGYSLFKDGPTALAQGMLSPDKVHLTPLGHEYAVAAMFSELRLGDLRTDVTRDRTAALAAYSPILSGRTLWADATQGNDATALRERGDRPFKTLRAAKTAALPGHTIIVAPGVYDERDLLRDEVNWFFLPGAEIRFTGKGAIWDDSVEGANGAVTSRIEGHGLFTTTGESASSSVFLFTNARSNVSVYARGISASGTAIVASSGRARFVCEQISTAASSAFVVDATGGDVEICDARISGSTSKALATVGPGSRALRFRRCTLVNSGTGQGSTCLQAGSAPATILDHCTLIAGAATRVSISAADRARIKTYQTVANRGLARGVTDLVGPLRVSAHVTE